MLQPADRRLRRIQVSATTVELVCDAKAELGEGPIWDYRRGLLCWLDITGKVIHIYDPVADRDRTIDAGQEVGCVALRSNGGLIFAGRNGFAEVDLESGAIADVLDPERHLPDNRFNDGKCDARGRFWAGTMNTRGQPNRGSLYCLYPDLRLRTLVTGVGISNGIAWSSDQKTMYYIDTPTREVAAFDFDADTGDLSGRRVVIRVPDEKGKPDGMTIDTQGMLWVALYGGGAVTRWDPRDGRLLATIEVPAPRVTSCAFAGLRMDELYITTARQGLDPKDAAAWPHSGGLFRARPGVRGSHEPLFGG
jgi:sugar lactone lactonase YvrE